MKPRIKVSSSRRPEKRGFGSGIARHWQLYLMLVLPIIYILVFKYEPMYGAQIAFRRFTPIKGIAGSKWVGLENFQKFFSSPMFSKLIKNTVLLSLFSMLASFPFSIILAIGLNYISNRRYRKTVQMITYIPYFISVVVMVGIMQQAFSLRFGVVNSVIKLLGGTPVDFFARPEYFRPLYVFSGIWQSAGWNSIIYISALAGVEPQLHEAAIVDGASIFKRVVHIDLPCILPTVVIMLILNMGSFLSIGFEKVYLMQNDLNAVTSEIIDTYVYKMGLASASANFSYSTAIGLFQSVIGFILTVAVNRISKLLTKTSLW